MLRKARTFLLLFLAVFATTASGEAFASRYNSVDLANRRAQLIEREHQLEANRDMINMRISQLKTQLSLLQQQSDRLYSDIGTVNQSIAETDEALASARY